MEVKDEQARPFAIPSSPTVHPSVDEADQRRSPHQRRRHHRALLCCGCCGAAVVILGAIILVLSLTVFRVKDPELTMNNLHIDSLFLPGIGTPENPLSFNATLTADISIKNPNAASFRFQNSASDFFYGSQLLGVAYAPEGIVKAGRTVRMNVTVDVMADRVVLDTNAAGVAVEEGGLNMSSFTKISGRVNLLGIYKRNLSISLNCSFTLVILENTLENTVCRANVS